MGDVVKVQAQTAIDLFQSTERKKAIRDYEDKDLLEQMMLSVKRIMRDNGMQVGEDTKYLVVRIMEIVRRHYGWLSVEDFRLAFELASVGKLEVDNRHYFRLTVDYVCRILNAYIRAKDEHRPEEKPKSEEKGITDDYRRLLNSCWLRYKYTGKLETTIVQEMFLYRDLQAEGYAEEINISEEDKRKAYNLFIQASIRGEKKEIDAFKVRKEGKDCELLGSDSYVIARRREIIKAFERKLYEC